MQHCTLTQLRLLAPVARGSCHIWVLFGTQGCLRRVDLACPPCPCYSRPPQDAGGGSRLLSTLQSMQAAGIKTVMFSLEWGWFEQAEGQLNW